MATVRNWQKKAARQTIELISGTPGAAHMWSMIVRWPPDEKEGKQNRWLGFIQGWAWTHGVELEILKQINRDQSDPLGPPAIGTAVCPWCGAGLIGKPAMCARHGPPPRPGSASQGPAYEDCKKRGPYFPLGYVEWECLTHGVELIRVGGEMGTDAKRSEMVCPVAFDLDRHNATHGSRA